MPPRSNRTWQDTLGLMPLRHPRMRPRERTAAVTCIDCLARSMNPPIHVAKVEALRESGMGPAAIAKQLKMFLLVLEGH